MRLHAALCSQACGRLLQVLKITTADLALDCVEVELPLDRILQAMRSLNAKIPGCDWLLKNSSTRAHSRMGHILLICVSIHRGALSAGLYSVED